MTTYQAEPRQAVYIDPADAGGWIVKAPPAPSNGTQFHVVALSASDVDVTLDGNGKNIEAPAWGLAPSPTYAGPLVGDVLTFTFSQPRDTWQLTADSASDMTWRGYYSGALNARRQDVTLDDGWLMVANKPTTDRPAPQPIGPPDYLLPDLSPAWTITPRTSTLVSANRLTVPAGELYQVVSWRVWVDEAEADDTQFDVFYRDETDPDPDNWITRFLASFTPGDVAIGKGTWNEVAGAGALFGPGDRFSIGVLQSNSSSSTTTPTNYTYIGASNQENDPGIGNIERRQQTNLRINKTDADAVDRALLLASVTPGTTIRIEETANSANFYLYQVTSTGTDYGTYVNFPISLTSQGNEPGLQSACTVTFDVPVPAGVQHLTLANHWLNDTNAEGWYVLDGGAEVITDNAHIVDIQLQEMTASDDWDVLATSAVGGGTGSGGQTFPGGTNRDVQFNDDGVFGGDSRLQWSTSQQLVFANASAVQTVIIDSTQAKVEVGDAFGSGEWRARFRSDDTDGGGQMLMRNATGTTTLAMNAGGPSTFGALALGPMQGDLRGFSAIQRAWFAGDYPSWPSFYPTPDPATLVLFSNHSASGDNCFIDVMSGNVGDCGIFFSDRYKQAAGAVRYDHATDSISLHADGAFIFYVDGTARFAFDSDDRFKLYADDGNIGVEMDGGDANTYLRLNNVAGTWRANFQAAGTSNDFGRFQLRDSGNAIVVSGVADDDGHLSIGTDTIAGRLLLAGPNVSQDLINFQRNTGTAWGRVSYNSAIPYNLDVEGTGRPLTLNATSGQFVGIGLTNPIHKLHIYHNGTTYILIDGPTTADLGFQWRREGGDAISLKRAANRDHLDLDASLSIGPRGDEAEVAPLAVEATGNSAHAVAARRFSYSPAVVIAAMGQGPRSHGYVNVYDNTGNERGAFDADYGFGKFVLKDDAGQNRAWISADPNGARYVYYPFTIGSGTTCYTDALLVNGDYSGASDPTAGSGNNITAVFSNSNSAYGLAVHVHNSGLSVLQGGNWNGTATHYPIKLNPYAHNVGIGGGTDVYPRTKLAVVGDYNGQSLPGLGSSSNWGFMSACSQDDIGLLSHQQYFSDHWLQVGRIANGTGSFDLELQPLGGQLKVPALATRLSHEGAGGALVSLTLGEALKKLAKLLVKALPAAVGTLSAEDQADLAELQTFINEMES